ncbi:MAG: hypothetical protein ACI9UN_005237 [Granulosicoccus sp.]|jgi:hypothetical protein
MMIRTLRLALLLTCCTSALAQPLYKWIEADGSITFSPEKPQKNIDFQVINAAEGVTASRIAVRDPATVNAMAADQTSYSQQISDGSAGLLQPVASSYSSGERLNASSLMVDRAGSNAGQQASMTSMMKQHSRQTTQSAAAAAVQKENRCEDLRKRVVSLERRLKSNLTAADMDNTVIQMSQYQRSYDQYCVQ